ncbi:FtsW/RodA/SpoVE family cell cycle protein [Candidatus Cyrtobacter comes]|uniref:FtsW/RodA/SpoVE family cell cycle protein n=1 Tax=Candidatus Cyrtobacter comes TaxID=675776 RepID=UPI002ACD9DD7|nr:FtsW/RodA/SpoVE family cell cycle protein [Candidatus Cyrtobacter comes]
MALRRGSKIGSWWWSIDSMTFLIVLFLMVISLLLVGSAGPAVAVRIGAAKFHFFQRHLVFICISLILIVFISCFSRKIVKLLSIFGFFIILSTLILLPYFGNEIKGAKRWFSIMGFAFQPSEFLKPFYAITIGSILSKDYKERFLFCITAHIIVISLLMLQPDFGATVTISMVVGIQLFISGIPLLWVFYILFFMGFVFFVAYNSMPHVASRINNFLYPEQTENYQVTKSLQSFESGGLLGRGPGEGVVKYSLPDAHTDFIFSVAAEELGVIFCMLLLLLFLIIFIRGVLVSTKTNDKFIIYSTVGLLSYLVIQSTFNSGVSMNLFPTKGMTLPFISYGGSSIISFSIAIGIYLSMTKKSFRHLSERISG